MIRLKARGLRACSAVGAVPPNGLGGLYRTTNRGVSWTKINSLDRVNSVAVDPDDPNEAYLTTETDGLWFTENLQSTNPTFTAVAGYHFMQPMRVVYNPYNSNEVWVTSFGGGFRVGEALLPGDFNRDGAITIADVPAMLIALSDLSTYRTSKGLSPTELVTLGDLDKDGAVTNRDVQSLICSIANQLSSSAIPAASTFSTADSSPSTRVNTDVAPSNDSTRSLKDTSSPDVSPFGFQTIGNGHTRLSQLDIGRSIAVEVDTSCSELNIVPGTQYTTIESTNSQKTATHSALQIADNFNLAVVAVERIRLIRHRFDMGSGKEEFAFDQYFEEIA